MARKYFSCVICQPEADYCEWIYNLIQNENAFIFHQDSSNHLEYYKIQPNDIIILSYKRSLVAYGQTTGIQQRNDDKGWTLSIPVIEWHYFDNANRETGISRYGIGFNHHGGNRDLIKRLDTSFGFNKIQEINKDNDLYRVILEEIKVNKQSMDIQKVKSVLLHKKQIILQGAPGTGKTRLAEILAKELTQPKNIGSPLQIIDAFFLSYNPSDPATKLKRQEIDQLHASFLSKFPIASLIDLTLEDYCIGTGENTSFCWWIERGLKSLGYYFPGRSWSYLIYWDKIKQEYSKHGFVKDIVNDVEAMKAVAALIDEIINKNNPEKGLGFFGDSLILKLLNTYRPDEYFPINGKDYLVNALKLFDVVDHKLTKIEMNKRLNEIFLEKKKQFNKDITGFEFMHFLSSNFDLENGTAILSDKTAIIQGEYEIIQFHPAYSYEDFVRGIVATTNLDSQVSYDVVNKILAKFAKKAECNPHNYFILIIDEINRANIPAVLGELIYALEYRDRPVSTIYEFENDSKITLPSNLLIIGTMNTTDRSIGHIDYAIRRRFAFIDILPKLSVIEEESTQNAVGLFKKIAALFCSDYKEDVYSLTNSEYLPNDFRPMDTMIGHSYFLAKDDDELKIKLDYEIKPILREYLKDGILLEKAKEIIESLDV